MVRGLARHVIPSHLANGRVLVLFLLLLGAGCRRTVVEPLTSVGVVRHLSLDQAARRQPVRVQGQVTFIDDPGKLFILQNGGHAVRVELGGPIRAFRPGSRGDALGQGSPFHVCLPSCASGA